MQSAQRGARDQIQRVLKRSGLSGGWGGKYLEDTAQSARGWWSREASSEANLPLDARLLSALPNRSSRDIHELRPELIHNTRPCARIQCMSPSLFRCCSSSGPTTSNLLGGTLRPGSAGLSRRWRGHFVWNGVSLAESGPAPCLVPSGDNLACTRAKSGRTTTKVGAR